MKPPPLGDAQIKGVLRSEFVVITYYFTFGYIDGVIQIPRNVICGFKMLQVVSLNTTNNLWSQIKVFFYIFTDFILQIISYIGIIHKVIVMMI